MIKKVIATIILLPGYLGFAALIFFAILMVRLFETEEEKRQRLLMKKDRFFNPRTLAGIDAVTGVKPNDVP